MGKKKTPGKAAGGEPDVAPFNNPFGSLGDLAAPAQSRVAPAELSEPGTASTEEDASGPYAGKLVLRRQRKGHRGKTVTVLQGVAMGERELSELARKLGRVLGVAARSQGTEILVAGDQCERLELWLRTLGADRVVRGS